MKVYTAHMLYRYESETNPSGWVIGVFSTKKKAEDAAVAEREKLKGKANEYDYEFFTNPWDVQ